MIHLQIKKKNDKSKPQSKQSPKPKEEKKLTPENKQIDIHKDWKSFCEKVKATKISIGNALELGVPQISDNKLLIKYHKAHNFQMNLLNNNKSIIEKLMKEEFDQSIYLKTDIDESIPEPKENKTINNEEIIKNVSKTDPLVNKLINELGLELT